MLRKIGLTSVSIAMLCSVCATAHAADTDAGNGQPAAPQSDVAKNPEPSSDKQPSPKEEKASSPSSKGDPAKPQEDPNCE
jgi:hypothetical protein